MTAYGTFILLAQDPHPSGTLEAYRVVALADRVILDRLETHNAGRVVVRLSISHGYQFMGILSEKVKIASSKLVRIGERVDTREVQSVEKKITNVR